MTSLLLTLACSDFSVSEAPPPPVATPPGEDPDALWGDPPDWNTCAYGFSAWTYNLPADHPDLEPFASGDTGVTSPAPLPPLDDRDWWSAEYLVGRGWDTTLDFGGGWWPVDQGLAGDPAGFTVRWLAWIRGFSDTTVELTFGAATDAYVLVDDRERAVIEGSRTFEPATVTFALDAGQSHLDVRFANRSASESGFRFRLVAGDAAICMPVLE